MAQSTTSASNATSNRGEQTWLLPSNRKLRKLVSISLRNLSLTPTSPARRRGKTIDDDALPQNLVSPAKMVALREQKALGHSRSSSDLRAVAENAIPKSDAAEDGLEGNGTPVAGKQKQRPKSTAGASPKRPEFRRLRRRSTLEWANATPQRRQERLEDMTKDRMVDVFFSLHLQGIEGWEIEPAYVSEVVEKTMNPTFRYVDWTACGPGIARLEQLVLRVWVRGAKADRWQQLLELKLETRGLQYLARNLDSVDRPLPPNAVLFHLTDGIYTSFKDSLSDFSPAAPQAQRKTVTSTSQRSLPTSSFDALLRLSKLDDSIQDALATRNQLAAELEHLLQTNKEALTQRVEVAEAEDRLKTIEYANKTVGRQLDKARKQQDEKRASLAARRELMSSDIAYRKAKSKEMREVQPQLPDMRDEHEVSKKAIQNQRRRICEQLQNCYPTQPLPGKTLAFSIRSLHLPDSEDLDAEPPEVVSAALGHVAHVLQLMAFYLAQPLPYPVRPRGSTSTIYDPISILRTNTPFTSHNTEQTLRTYPLYSKSVPRFRYEYAVFLLNQDIRVLFESVLNVRVLDIRQTLPNLKYLLYIATAGDGELPARKTGGVRGLMKAPVLERVGSVDSMSSGISGLTLLGNGKPRSAIERLREISGKG